jgi:hypothetical protein
MSTVHEIEQAIRNLEPQDLAVLRQWFAEFDPEFWERQLEQDVAAGKLNWLAEEALRDLNDGRCTDLLRHRATPRVWPCYNALPADVRPLADRCYTLLCHDPHHPSLHFKKSGQFWSVRVGLNYRALAVECCTHIVWVWVGSYAEYNRLIANA